MEWNDAWPPMPYMYVKGCPDHPTTHPGSYGHPWTPGHQLGAHAAIASSFPQQTEVLATAIIKVTRLGSCGQSVRLLFLQIKIQYITCIPNYLTLSCLVHVHVHASTWYMYMYWCSQELGIYTVHVSTCVHVHVRTCNTSQHVLRLFRFSISSNK